MFKKYQLRNYNFRLVLFSIMITMIGIFAIGSAKESVQGKQIIGFGLGIVIMIVVSLIDYSFVLKFYWIIYALNTGLLIAVLLTGKSAGGAQRWINLGFRFQPSELAKILLILFFAQFIIKHREKLNTFRILGSLVALLAVPLFCVYKQPDLSTSIMIFIIFCVLLFIGGISYKIIIGVLAVVIPVAVIALVLVMQPDQKIIKEYQQTRILAWLQPEKYENAEGYQQQNSIIAIGSGQLTGKGYKNNEVGSVKNGNFISEPQTDFIFAIVGEEFGFLGAMSVVILICLIVIEIINTGRKAKDLAGTLICAGMAGLIGFQSFINIGVATGVTPNTGIPLPFLSYGLTSLDSLFIGLGFVLNVGLQQKKYPSGNLDKDWR